VKPPFRTGKIAEISAQSTDVVEAVVDTGAERVRAVGYPQMLGPVRTGDRVVMNTVGIDLGLGTGGVAFMLWNLDGEGPQQPPPGHIVKLRYTPWQTAVLAAESQESPLHEALVDAQSLMGMPVVAAGLHSQVPAVAAAIKAHNTAARVGYLMTDGGALPLAFSRLLRRCRNAGLVDVTATCGHAFGGDLECVNVFSGLVALRHAAACDAAVVATGPGVVGTGTALGHSAMEQGQVLDAAAALDGWSVACLRINFSEARERHRGVSHHTMTALRLAARERCRVAVPDLGDRTARILEALDESGVSARHDVHVVDGAKGMEHMRSLGVEPSSMGRSLDEIPELFLAGSAAGHLAAEAGAEPESAP
jgi:hypothetical protein